MNGARTKLEGLLGHELDAYYHATWAESPTCDAWAPGGVHGSWSADEHRRKYEYTPDFVWSNTVHQAAAACANYFLWNDFLTGGNNDTPEGGFADRDYYARALACSLAALNRHPLASAGMWGMPPAVGERMLAVSQVYGALGHPVFRSVQDYAPRDVEVLFLYPQDLVAVDERFGSWMVQYGYANYITAEKLVEHGRVDADGWLRVKNNRYRAVCALYEPFPSEAVVEPAEPVRPGRRHGGLVQRPAADRKSRRRRLPALAGRPVRRAVDYTRPTRSACRCRAARWCSRARSAPSPPQLIPSDFVVDRVFPVEPLGGASSVAVLNTGGPEVKRCVGTWRTFAGGGQAVYLGFRPRDDQAASTGVEVRTWFEVLSALGAYPAQRQSRHVISRTSELLACAFPNGAVAACPHFRDYPENWPGGFFRDEELDQRIMLDNPPPDNSLALRELRVAGQTVDYRGRHSVVWRCDAAGRLIAFAGFECTGITFERPRLPLVGSAGGCRLAPAGAGTTRRELRADLPRLGRRAGPGAPAAQSGRRQPGSLAGRARAVGQPDPPGGLRARRLRHAPGPVHRQRREPGSGHRRRDGRPLAVRRQAGVSHE